MWCPCVLFVLVIISPSPVVSVFDLNIRILEINRALLETFNGMNELPDLDDSDIRRKHILPSLNNIIQQMGDIDLRMSESGSQEHLIRRILENISDLVRLESKLTYLNIYYKDMEKYIRDFDKYENSTLLNFADKIVSDMCNSVPRMMESINQELVKQDIIYLFLERFNIMTSAYFCKKKQSMAQVLHNFMNEMLVINMKSYILIHTAYMIKKLYKTGNFRKEIEDANKEFQSRTENILLIIKPYIANSSLELWKCDPIQHKKGETYIEITNFLRGIILNEQELGGCLGKCNDYAYTKDYDCKSDWCKKQGTCSKVVDCSFVASSMSVCQSTVPKSHNRRHEYIEFENGEVFGRLKTCRSEVKYWRTYSYWLFWNCDYCFCLCEKSSSERFINMRLAQSNITDNKVVTGLRFVEQNRIIYLQIQEGKLLPYGQIDVDSVQWVPVEDYNLTNKTYSDGKYYYKIKLEQRDFDLKDIIAKEGSVITGVAFRKIDSRLHLQIQTTPFNFTTGNLTAKLTVLQDDPHVALKHKFDLQLKLHEVDVPTRSRLPSNKFTTNKFVQFTNTGYEQDAGQTTVPFFDAQPVESAPPVPLGGVGVFHKGTAGFGGFIAPRIFTYNFSQHLELAFSQNKND